MYRYAKKGVVVLSLLLSFPVISWSTTRNITNALFQDSEQALAQALNAQGPLTQLEKNRLVACNATRLDAAQVWYTSVVTSSCFAVGVQTLMGIGIAGLVYGIAPNNIGAASGASAGTVLVGLGIYRAYCTIRQAAHIRDNRQRMHHILEKAPILRVELYAEASGGTLG